MKKKKKNRIKKSHSQFNKKLKSRVKNFIAKENIFAFFLIAVIIVSVVLLHIFNSGINFLDRLLEDKDKLVEKARQIINKYEDKRKEIEKLDKEYAEQINSSGIE